MNTGTDAQRIAAGRLREQRLLDQAAWHGLDIAPASRHEDRTLKVDGWWLNGPLPRASVQVKTRDDAATRQDLGLAIFRPYDPTTRAGAPDRDWSHCPDYYLTALHHHLLLVAGPAVHHLVRGLLRAPEGYASRSGSQLVVTRDKGQGYAAHQLKLMAYLTPTDLVRYAGAEIL